MQITIHRGSHEIGGTCVELQSNDGSRLILDVGAPLPSLSGEKKPAVGKLSVRGLFKDDPADSSAVKGILISHAHQDHYGMLQNVRPDIPCFAGAATYELMQITSDFTRSNINIPLKNIFISGGQFTCGAFHITPYLVNHSAIDAHAFLIECDGQRVFYSGDFRGHGRSLELLNDIEKKGIGVVDVILLEGTMMSRQTTRIVSEQLLESQIAEKLKEEKVLALACVSGQNIDRIMTLLEAAKISGRTLVIDAYNAYVLQTLHEFYPELPCIGARDCENLKVQYTKYLCRKIRCDLQKGEWLDQWDAYKVDLRDVWRYPQKYLFLVRPGNASQLRRFLRSAAVNALLIYSQWDGYWDQPSMSPLKDWCDELHMHRVYLHTSGHAYLSDLKYLVNAVQPKTIIPVHTEIPEEYQAHFSQPVTVLHDGQIYKI